MGLAANTGQPVIVSRAENQVAESLVRIKIIKGNPLLTLLHYLLQNADTLSILPIFENQVMTALYVCIVCNRTVLNKITIAGSSLRCD